MIRIEGRRVVLRPFRADELDEVARLHAESTVMLGRAGRDRLRQRLERSGAWHEDRLDLAIEADGALAGDVDVRSGRQMLPPGVCEVGIGLFADRRGGGIGTEAIELLTAWLHESGFQRVQAGTDVGNASMRRVFAKAGWVEEGVMHAFMPSSGARADFVLCAHVVQRRREAESNCSYESL